LWNDVKVITKSAACICKLPTILNSVCCGQVEIPLSNNKVHGIAPDCLHLD
jgi:hypothetical protein